MYLIKAVYEVASGSICVEYFVHITVIASIACLQS